MSVASIELFTVQQLADFLHKKPCTVYSDLIRRPESLPPVFRAPGSSRPLFVNPHQWVNDLLEKQTTPPLPLPLAQGTPEKKKRGRPSNKEAALRKAKSNRGAV